MKLLRLIAIDHRVGNIVNNQTQGLRAYSKILFGIILVSHDSYLVRFVANRATVVHARSQSFLGRSVLFCAHRYHFYFNICKRLNSSFDKDAAR